MKEARNSFRRRGVHIDNTPFISTLPLHFDKGHYQQVVSDVVRKSSGSLSERYDSLSVLDDLAKTRIDNISWRVHFSDSDETKLEDLGEKAYETYSIFADIKSTSGIDIDAEQVLARLNGVSADKLHSIHATIEDSYEDVAPASFLETLDSLQKYEDSDFERLREGSKSVSGGQYGFTPQVRQRLGLVKLRADPLVSLMDTLYEEESVVGDAVAPKFQEVASYYVGE